MWGGHHGHLLGDTTLQGLHLWRRPEALPVTLAVSTVTGGICVFILQVPTLCKFTSMSPAVLFWGFSVVYGVIWRGSVLHALIRICYKLWL